MIASGRAARDPIPTSSLPDTMAVTLHVNGVARTLYVRPWTTLLDALRHHLDLAGTKKGCDHGQCGACTVLVGGRRINSCLALAVMQDDREITTIEGLGRGDTLHPLQQAFIDHDAFQCGYCTPGQICSAAGLINEGKAHNRDDIREFMSGNICRCGAYTNIVAAIEEVMESRRASAAGILGRSERSSAQLAADAELAPHPLPLRERVDASEASGRVRGSSATPARKEASPENLR